MFKKVQSALIEWKPVNNTMAYAPFKGKFYSISAINVYNSLCVDGSDKGKLHTELQWLIKSLTKNGIIWRNWNAHIGHDAAW